MEYRVAYPNELYHHGIKSQRWGVRKYQNPDGSLTSAGKKRYKKQFKRKVQSIEFDAKVAMDAVARFDRLAKRYEKAKNAYDKKPTDKNKEKVERLGKFATKVFEADQEVIKKVRTSIAEAKKVSDIILAEHKDMKLYSVPESVEEAGKRYTRRYLAAKSVGNIVGFAGGVGVTLGLGAPMTAVAIGTVTGNSAASRQENKLRAERYGELMR